MGDAFEPPTSAVEAVRKKLSHFFLLVDMPDADFDKMEYKARYQSVADYFEISPDHYTGSTTTGIKRENVAKTLVSLRSAFKPSWVSRERLNLARDLLRGYVGCMFCLKEGARAGLMSTVSKPVSSHSLSDTHLRATTPADGVEPGLPMPPAGLLEEAYQLRRSSLFAQLARSIHPPHQLQEQVPRLQKLRPVKALWEILASQLVVFRATNQYAPSSPAAAHRSDCHRTPPLASSTRTYSL